MEPKKDDPGAIPEPSDRRIGFEALFIKLSVKQGSVHDGRIRLLVLDQLQMIIRENQFFERQR